MTVAALRWTSSGAVASPETLHVRLEPAFEGRVAAGAPVPSRALTDGEVLDNVRWFVDPGPRARSVRALLVSGVTEPRLDGIEALAASARAAGIERVVAHLPVALARDVPGVDDVAVAVRTVAEARAATGRQVSVPLEAEVLPVLRDVLEVLEGRVTLLWPLAERLPPAAGQVVDALRGASVALGRLDWGLKGLPRCALGELEVHAWRSANRWYVDADHQREAALLFRPDLVRFDKRDACRFCAADAACDGVPSEWLARGLAGPLIPLRADPDPR